MRDLLAVLASGIGWVFLVFIGLPLIVFGPIALFMGIVTLEVSAGVVGLVLIGLCLPYLLHVTRDG